MSSHIIALLTIVGASLLWSTAGVAKILVRAFDPFTAVFLRFFIASICILPFFVREKFKNKQRLFFDIVPISLLSSLNVVFYYFGLATSTANAAAIIYTIGPLIVLVVAPKLIKEVITTQKRVGILVGLFGALLITTLPLWEKGTIMSGNFIGNIFFLVATTVWSLYTIGSKYLAEQKHHSPIAISSISIFATTVIFFPFAIYYYQPKYASLLRQPTNVFLFLYIGILLTVSTYLLKQIAVKHSSASTVSLHVYLQVVFAVLFNILFLGENLTIGFVVGSIVVMAGVFFATKNQLLEELKKLIRSLSAPGQN